MKKTKTYSEHEYKRLSDQLEEQMKLVWTYQKFFFTFEDELKPLIRKWKDIVGADPYVYEIDPVTEKWLERIESVREEEREMCKFLMEDKD